jgi:pyruvate dehydrogenase E1 component alpha subunit
LPTQVSIAAQLPHATGLAWGLRLRGEDAVVLAYIGEGGSSEGDFHEALNLAGMTRAPVVFFLQNNQWAISTSRRVQSATPSFALRAAGYGFEGIEVDGNDVMAVYDIVGTGVERARAGGGPTLIEAVTYRMSFHNTTDNPSLYQDPEEYQEARRRDPIERVQKYLAGLGLWDQSREDDVTAEVRQEIESALEAAVAGAPPSARDLFDNIYEHPPERFLRQRAELLDAQP